MFFILIVYFYFYSDEKGALLLQLKSHFFPNKYLDPAHVTSWKVHGHFNVLDKLLSYFQGHFTA